MSSEVHEIDGIGEFRTRPGTAAGELAGAAEYWAKRAKRSERINSTMWGKGFTAGCFLGVVPTALVLALHHFHIWF